MKDLYIPPNAMQVFLESFEGPLDLLLYLIQTQELDILNIPIADITNQYVEYIDLMQELDLELAAEYLLMAALLMEIKSRMLLPQTTTEAASDPRKKLVQQLQEYAQYKQAAQDIDALARIDRDLFIASVEYQQVEKQTIVPTIEYSELLVAIKDVMQRATLLNSHKIIREALSVRERMSLILEKIKSTTTTINFVNLFTLEEGRAGVVVTLLAILELVKESLIQIELININDRS
jgi:segregation and condensation protein A